MIHFKGSFVHTFSPLQFIDEVIGGQLEMSYVALAYLAYCVSSSPGQHLHRPTLALIILFYTGDRQAI